MRVVEVPGSHIGAVYEPAAYEALAHRLADASRAAAARAS
jgi:hypothetical protein